MIEGLVCWLIKIFTGAKAQWTEATYHLPPGQRVYYANHSSHLDFLILWACLPRPLRRQTRPVAAKDYWSKRQSRLWVAEHVFRAILIERTHISRTNNPIDQLTEALSAGDSLIIFPEGTRGSGEALGTFKSGLYHLAEKYSGPHYIPVYLENLNRVLPKGEFIPIPLICSVTFGAPLEPVGTRTKDEFLAEARSALLTLNA